MVRPYAGSCFAYSYVIANLPEILSKKLSRSLRRAKGNNAFKRSEYTKCLLLVLIQIKLSFVGAHDGNRQKHLFFIFDKILSHCVVA